MIVNLTGNIRLPKIFGDSKKGKTKLQKCIDFVEEHVMCALNSGEKEIYVHKLFGGDNSDWVGLNYPIGELYTELCNKYQNEGYSDYESQAMKQAGIYVGFILKFVCHYLEIKFKMTRTYSTIIYNVI